LPPKGKALEDAVSPARWCGARWGKPAACVMMEAAQNGPAGPFWTEPSLVAWSEDEHFAWQAKLSSQQADHPQLEGELFTRLKRHFWGWF